MYTILIFGAGKSATCLIAYLCKACEVNGWRLLVCDTDLELAQSKIRNCEKATALSTDVNDPSERLELIRGASIVISMLPPHLHFLVASDCLRLSRHLLTASYLDENLKKLGSSIKEKNLLFLCEMGLDPGIDHMSAMKLINAVKKKGGTIESFISHCGGLVSPESDDNPWHYKITWNPANIVMAGAAGAVYKFNGEVVTIPYREIFSDCQSVDIPGLFPLAWYANRDSLGYINTYGLGDIATFIRTTLRHPAFCRGWNHIVNWGLTDREDYEEIKNCQTVHEWFRLKKEHRTTPAGNDRGKAEFTEQIDFLGLRSHARIPAPVKNSAGVLQWILEGKLAMQPQDRDMIVMLHEIGYVLEGEKKQTRSCLIVKGEDQRQTAMAKTVGLPLGIAATLLLQGKIKLTGLHIPVMPEIYEPVLQELEANQVTFSEEMA